MACLAWQVLCAVLRLVKSVAIAPWEAIDIFLPNIWQTSETRFDPARDIPSLHGQVFLVTGGNTGIGYETVLQLAKHDPKHIYLAARTESKARRAIDAIRIATGFARISWLPLDLASLSSTSRAANTLLKECDRLDVLILNAGIMATPPASTDAGHDLQLGTNHVGHFLLTMLLLPKLLDTARLPNSDVRVITVASEANKMAPTFKTIISGDELNRSDPVTRYGASKAANVLFAAELARRYPQLTSVSVHPGLVTTDLYRPGADASVLMRMGLKLLSWAFVSAREGALTQLYAAAGARRGTLKNGQYYTPYGKLRRNTWAADADKGIQLWQWTQAELQRSGY